jgi:hypothetical protein
MTTCAPLLHLRFPALIRTCKNRFEIELSLLVGPLMHVGSRHTNPFAANTYRVDF